MTEFFLKEAFYTVHVDTNCLQVHSQLCIQHLYLTSSNVCALFC